MKKFTIFTAALALLASASCVKETIVPETTEGDGVSFVALREDFGATTKTQLVDGCKVEWKTNNEVLVFGEGIGDDKDDKATGSETFDAEAWKSAKWFKTSTGGSSVRFVCTDPNYEFKSNEYIMLHPAGGNYYGLCTDDGMYMRFWLSDQTATLGTYHETYGYCAAKTSDFSKPVVFKNLLPLLKFTVPASLDGRITKITVTGNNNEFVAGNMICDYTGDAPVVKVFAEFKEAYKYKGGKTSVALTSTGMAAGNYYLALAPKTYSKGLKVTVTYKDSKTSTRSSSASVTLQSGVIYDMGNVGAENYSGPGIALPYVFPFYATAGTGNEPKHVEKVTVTAQTHFQLKEAGTGSAFDMKTSGSYADFWANKWYGQDNLIGQYFTGETTYFMLTAPLRTSLPATFRVSFGFFVDSKKNDVIKDWKLQYSKDNETWYDGATFQIPRILKYHSFEITPEIAFSAGDNLYLKWLPVGNASWNGGTTDGLNGQLHFASGVAITDVTSPDSNASGNVYAEDFDRINGGVDYRHAGQTDGIEKLGQLGEIFGDSIENWTAEQKNGLSGSYVAERPGYVQIGYATYLNDDRNVGATSANITKYVGSLVTPALTKASGTINLSFKAMCYRSPYTGRASMSAAAQADVTDIVVNIKGAGSFDASSTVTSKTLSGISTSKFDKKALTIYNSDATTQIEFTSTAVSGKFTRWFLDDICVNKAQ
ncbi:MAG: hypothetical protein E7124_10150 [Bacteroidales bacterium]|nr:hypothetical protein [Bacteroidales bacterium]